MDVIINLSDEKSGTYPLSPSRRSKSATQGITQHHQAILQHHAATEIPPAYQRRQNLRVSIFWLHT